MFHWNQFIPARWRLVLCNWSRKDFLKKDNTRLSKADILKAIAEWSPRKAQQMTDTYVTVALERLSHYENNVLA